MSHLNIQSLLFLVYISESNIMMVFSLPATSPGIQVSPLQDEYQEYSNKARHGHGRDIHDENDIRQVAGCLPLDLENNLLMLISSKKKKGAWVLPKGGWEYGETQKHAAKRETWEEAGIKGSITQFLGVFEERSYKKRNLKAHHWIFEMKIGEVAKKFPERKKRERRWFTFEESLVATRDHHYIQQAIIKSSLNPACRPPSPRVSNDRSNTVDEKSIINYANPDEMRRTTIISTIRSLFKL